MLKSVFFLLFAMSLNAQTFEGSKKLPETHVYRYEKMQINKARIAVSIPVFIAGQYAASKIDSRLLSIICGLAASFGEAMILKSSIGVHKYKRSLTIY